MRRALPATAVLLVACATWSPPADSQEVRAADASRIDFDRGAAQLPGARMPAAGSEEAEAYLRAAEAGDRRAQSRLGVMYRTGRGIAQSDAKAFRWFREAALAGDAAAQHYLGLFYLSGVGTDIDLEEATVWLRRCAELNEPETLLSLAWFTLDENRLPHHAVHTAALLRNTAELGYAVAQYSLGVFRQDRAGEAPAEEALAWLRQSAEGGLPEAQFQLGVALLDGRGVPPQPEEALTWFSRAAERGFARAMRNLGVAYLVGRGVDRDVAVAYRWFWLAARHGSAAARQDVDHLEALLGDDVLRQARAAGLAWERAQALSGGAGAVPPSP